MTTELAVCPSRCSTVMPAPAAGFVAASGELAVLDLVVQGQDGVHQRLGARRATRCVHVDGNDLVDALHECVVVEHAAAAGADAHGDDPLGFHHLVVDLAQDRCHLLAEAAGDDHEIGLAGRRAERLHAPAGRGRSARHRWPSSRWRSRRARTWRATWTSCATTKRGLRGGRSRSCDRAHRGLGSRSRRCHRRAEGWACAMPPRPRRSGPRGRHGGWSCWRSGWG